VDRNIRFIQSYTPDLLQEVLTDWFRCSKALTSCQRPILDRIVFITSQVSAMPSRLSIAIHVFKHSHPCTPTYPDLYSSAIKHVFNHNRHPVTNGPDFEASTSIPESLYPGTDRRHSSRKCSALPFTKPAKEQWPRPHS